MDRDLFLDKIKGVAIILVVWGHCLQFCADYNFWNNRLFELIYTFHMPLFMAISGYLYYFSLNRGCFKDLVISRIKQLLIPLLIWNLVFLILFRRNISHSPLEWIKNYIYNLPFFFWFLWSLLICSLSTVVINKFFKGSLIAFLILLLILILLPNKLGFYFTKYMMPYFLAGYFVNKYALKNNIFVFVVALLVFTLGWYFWKYEYYIYNSFMATQLSDRKGIYDDCYRFIAGFAGIIVFLTLVKKIPDLKVFGILGKYTFGIYILGSFFNSYLKLLRLHYDPFWYNFVYTLSIALVIIAVCVALSMLIGKSKLLNRYLLGGR